MWRRLLTLGLVPLLAAALASGCAGQTDTKGSNKDKDRPVPQSTWAEGAVPAPGEAG